MTQLPTSPWHKESYDNFINEKLPQLLAARLPLAGYRVTSSSDQACTLTVAIRNGNGEIEVEYQDIPYPNEEGIFQIASQPYVVIPLAFDDHLDRAEIHCVGEQLYAEVEAHLGEAPDHISWDADLLGIWLPLTKWITDFIQERGQILDTTNWLSEQRHLRAILLTQRERLITPGHFGRVCPFETPEGPNIGKVLRVAVGATIQGGKLVISESNPSAGLGVSASMIPLLEHDDPNRLLMGANMMGQWVVHPDPEPALVQTGNEPNAPNFWCGRNLLTAFISWGADTYNDALVLSQSAAARLNFPHDLEAGDKLSNRHGTKGVVARVLPDDEMPHLSDGTPLELLYSFRGVPLRLNFGQIREALLGRIAQREGVPFVSPAYQAPSESDIKSRLENLGLPTDGMETLTLGAADGPMLERPALVGYVYWGKTVHLSRFKLRAAQDAPAEQARAQGLQYQGEMEYKALRDAGALKVAEKVYNLQAVGRPEGLTHSPKFAALQGRLNAAGIQTSIEEDAAKKNSLAGLKFEFAPIQGETLTLAQPVPHPWLRERQIAEVGSDDSLPEYATLVEINARLERLLESQAPSSLAENVAAQLESAVHDYFAALLPNADLSFGGRVTFSGRAPIGFGNRVTHSGRAVIIPGRDLRLDQVGLPEEVAWTFFGPQVSQILDDATAVENRMQAAKESLDQIMAESWVVINRAPTTSPTAVLAFHPVRRAEPTVSIHPLVCRWLEADFDGDQVAYYLPLGEAAQLEAAEKLSVAGHLRRDPALIESLSPEKEIVWGLGSLCLTSEGRAKVTEQTGLEIPSPEEVNTQNALTDILATLLAEKGVDDVLETLEKLKDLGFEAVIKSGASIHPFLGSSLEPIPIPESEDPVRWREYVAQYEEQIISRKDYENNDLGVHLITMRTNSRPPQAHGLAWLMANRDPVWDVNGVPVIVRNNSVSGLTPDEMDACVVRSREGLAQVAQQWEQLGQKMLGDSDPVNFNVLARARRAQYPGVVFARAAAIGERDPLTDVDSRLFVGLPAK